MKRCLTALFIPLLLTLACVSAAPSQDTSGISLPSASSVAPGTLAGHAFVPSSFIKDPFVRTFFRTGLGFGITPALDVPPVTINGKTVKGPGGNLLFAVLNAEYQYAVRDWLAVNGRISVLGRMADETPVLLSQGVTLISGFELGWLFRLSQSDRLALSGTLNVKSASLTDLYLQRFVEGIIDSGDLRPENRLVQTTPVLRAGGGVVGAYAFSELVGFTVTGELDYGESSDRLSGDHWFYSLVGMVDFNFSQGGGIPVGFIVGAGTGSVQQGVQPSSLTSQKYFGRIGYTGSREFAFGLDLAYELIPVRNLADRQGFLSALVDIRLYF